MPPNSIPSRDTLTDSVFLRPWIRKLFRERRLNGHGFQKPIRNVIPRLSETDMEAPLRSERIMRNKRHFMKITNFHKVEDYRVYASIRDNERQMLS